jgi:hypothetical protein
MAGTVTFADLPSANSGIGSLEVERSGVTNRITPFMHTHWLHPHDFYTTEVNSTVIFKDNPFIERVAAIHLTTASTYTISAAIPPVPWLSSGIISELDVWHSRESTTGAPNAWKLILGVEFYRYGANITAASTLANGSYSSTSSTGYILQAGSNEYELDQETLMNPILSTNPLLGSTSDALLQLKKIPIPDNVDWIVINLERNWSSSDDTLSGDVLIYGVRLRFLESSAFEKYQGPIISY